MRNSIYVILVLLILAMIVTSCSQKSADPNGPDPVRQLTSAELMIANSGNNFGFNIFQALNEENKPDNLFISPLSISFALGMAYNGADGETRAAIGKTLGADNLSLEEFNLSYRNLMDFLTGLDKSVAVQIANSNWLRQGIDIKQQFISLNQTYFDADVTRLVFDDAACAVINDWVDQKTNGKIDNIINPPIDPLTMLFLINAVYFKGDWTWQFDPAKTVNDLFYPESGTGISHPFMFQFTKFSYYGDNTVQVIDLPYGDKYYSMTIFLPAPGTDIYSFAAGFTRERFDSLIAALTEEEVYLAMPKFKLEAEYKLNGILAALGMAVAFDCETADFTNINDQMDLCISQVKHKTFIEVDEKGTEAAAVTVIEIGTTSYPPEEIHMTINRPFVFVIRDTQSNALLFMGKIITPDV